MRNKDETGSQICEESFKAHREIAELKDQIKYYKKKRIPEARATIALLKLFAKKSSRREYLESIVQLVQKLSGCRCTGFRMLNHDGKIPYESYHGFNREFWEQENWLSTQDQCACIRVITGKSEPQDTPAMTPVGSFCCNNISEFTNKLTEAELSRFRGTCVKYGFKSVSIIPIFYRHKILGAIHLADEEEGKVPVQLVQFLESLSPLIGEAIHRFSLEDELRENRDQLRTLAAELLFTEERERRRIASDIHDYIGQPLAVTKIKLAVLQELLCDTALVERVEAIGQLISEAIEHTRSLTFDLSPPVLYELGLEAAIKWLGEQIHEQHNIRFRYEDDSKLKPVDDEIRVLLFTAVRELLINTVKHAMAKEVKISVKNYGERLRISVKDDGVGFDPAASESDKGKNSGFGLFSIRERLQHLGGGIMVESKPGCGTCITLEAPMNIHKASILKKRL